MNTDIMDEIKENRKKFRVDHFDIVISEYINRYKDKKVILDPPYQRVFRWDIEKQSTLIESILIGIPLPPIFAFSNDDYDWEIIDGVQRTTTLLRFLAPEIFGKDAEDQIIQGCSILTSLNGKKISELPNNIISAINNFRLRIELVEDTSDSYSQYLLFSRLNNNGEPLSSQELRNFLIYKLNSEFYSELSILKKHTSFVNAFNLSKKRTKKQEDVEYILRFLLCRDIMIHNNANHQKYSTIDELITKEIEKYLTLKDNEYLINEYNLFKETYDFIVNLLGNNSFRHFHRRTNSVINTSIIGPVISTNLELFKNLDKEVLLEIIKNFYESGDYIKITSQSYSPTRRFFVLSEYTKQYFDSAIGELNNGTTKKEF